MPSRYDYEALARQAILALLTEEHACVWAEAQAKIADRRHPSVPTRIDPHHLTTARRQLLDSDQIAETHATTHGAHSVSVLHLADVDGRRTAIARAAARKRSLNASFLGWASATKEHPQGLLGPGGERSVHLALRAAAPRGLTLLNAETGGINALFGRPIPGGPLDNGAWVTSLDSQGRPGQPVLSPIEVKNVRHWLYPRAPEVFQLLYKAAALQRDEPTTPIAPVLVCRERHFLLNRMSNDLGFRVINARKQFLLPAATVQPSILAAVQSELGFTDLVPLDLSTPDDGLTKVFGLLPHEAQDVATRWKEVGSAFMDLYADLRAPNLPDFQRHAALDDLKQEVKRVLGTTVQW